MAFPPSPAAAPDARRPRRPASGARGPGLASTLHMTLPGLFWPAVAGAQFSVSPVVVSVPTDAGSGAAAGAVTVRNEGDQPLAVRFSIADFEQSEDGRHDFFPAGSQPGGCGPSVRVTPEATSVPPGSSERIRFDVAGAPADRTCWFVLFVEHPAPAGTGVLIRQRIGVKVFAVPPGALPGGEIAGGGVEKEDGGPRTLALLYRNPGAAPARPSGSVEVRDFRGGLVASAPVRSFTVLPEGARRIEVELPAGLDAGRYLAIPVLDFGGEYLAGAQFPFRVP